MVLINLIGNYLLNFVAQALLLLVYPINLCAEIFIAIRVHLGMGKLVKKAAEETSSNFYSNGLALDIFGNEHYETLWNLTFRKKGGYPFGKKGETLSVAMAKNHKRKKLSWFAYIFWVLIIIFDVTTWGKGGHFHKLHLKNPQHGN